MRAFTNVLLVWLIAGMSGPLRASDHADPIFLPHSHIGANITGLFFFPDGEDYVAILNVRPGTTATPPYELEPFEYLIFIDLHTEVTFEDAQELARYGGSIPKPEGIAPDITLSFRLANDASLDSLEVVGVPDPDAIEVYTGLRDDPFIFPRFFEKNVVSIVARIPSAAFPADRTYWLLWGTTWDTERDEQVDHVGRSNRTQLGRFDLLNTVPPDRQLARLNEANEKRDKIQDFLGACLSPLASLNELSGFQLRDYDFFPDVMVYNRERPMGYPNGRHPADDVAGLTCDQGDCSLIELSFAEGGFPRQTVNDKPFQDTYPFLAEPWPASPEAPGPSCRPYLWMYLILPLVGLVAVIVVVRLLLRRKHHGAAAT